MRKIPGGLPIIFKNLFIDVCLFFLSFLKTETRNICHLQLAFPFLEHLKFSYICLLPVTSFPILVSIFHEFCFRFVFLNVNKNLTEIPFPFKSLSFGYNRLHNESLSEHCNYRNTYASYCISNDWSESDIRGIKFDWSRWFRTKSNREYVLASLPLSLS